MKKTVWFPPNAIRKLKLKRADAALLKNVGRYDWILFSSKNTVTFFMEEIRSRGVKVPRSVRIAAVGSETARALRSEGLRVSLTPKKFSTEDLVKALGARVAGRRILFPRSGIAPESPVRVLRAAGANVDVVHLYTSVQARLPASFLSALKKGAPDYLVLTSPSAADSFVRNMRRQGMKEIAAGARAVSAVCIGPSTTSAARSFPFKKIFTARAATKAGIIRLLQGLP